MTTADDKAVATRVHDAVRGLNEALREAYEAGLHVELDCIAMQQISERTPRRGYSATVERREVVE